MNVAAILKAKGGSIVTVKPDTPLVEVVRLMAEKRIGAVVVSSDGIRPQGILSERDIVGSLSARGPATLEKKAHELMTARVTTCSPEDEVANLMAVMTTKRIRHLPVIQNGSLCGIISIGDVVKWRVEEIEREADALRAYVAQA
jgi:CBS domain-containing protein